MKYPEEGYANDLLAALSDQIGTSWPATRVTVHGEGVSWCCLASRAGSSCTIGCFRGPEYYTEFRHGSQTMAAARTSDRDGTMAAVSDWLDTGSKAVLYERFPFVDTSKRLLESTRERVSQAVPELAQTAQLNHDMADFYDLHFAHGDRSCALSSSEGEVLPYVSFAWDQCKLFAVQPTDESQLTAMLERWVLGHAKPSEMQREFPILSIGMLAYAYEHGRPIEGEFVRSWDVVERFFEEYLYFARIPESVLTMIYDMRRAGYDRRLRAGQSLTNLGLSRSRRHGLRDDQPALWFHFRKSTMNVQSRGGFGSLQDHPIRLTEDVQELLDALAERDID